MDVWAECGKNVMRDSSSRQRPLSHASSWTEFLSVSEPNLIYVCSLLTQQFLNSCVCLRAVSILCASHNWHNGQCLALSKSISPKNMSSSLHVHCDMCLICHLLRSVSVRTVTLSVVSVSQKKIPELHLSVTESWNSHSERVCQEINIIPASSSQRVGKSAEYTEFGLQLWKQPEIPPKQLLTLSE